MGWRFFMQWGLAVAILAAPSFTTAQVAVARLTTSGGLDSGFSGDGKNAFDFGCGRPVDVAASGNKVFIVGRDCSGGQNWILRTTTSGSLDTSFAAAGIAYLPSWLLPNAVTVDASGRPLIAAEVLGSFAVARLTNAGLLDTSFSTDGVHPFLVDGLCGQALDLAVLPDHKIVATGQAFDCADPAEALMAVARLGVNGTLDTTFASDGTQTVDLVGTGIEISTGVATDGNKVVISGWGILGTFPSSHTYVLVAAKLQATGLPDISFSDDGQTTTDFGAFDPLYSGRVAVDSSHRVIAVSRVYQQGLGLSFGLVRFRSSGLPDKDFDTDGHVVTDWPGSDEEAVDVSIQRDGKIVATGTVMDTGASQRMGVARYLTNGTLDTSYSGDGRASVGFGLGDVVTVGSTLDANGRVVIVAWPQ